ncbi:tetratricopeptide repeat protein [Bacillus sp. DTU_2020_1000418_1_SI_GHA_SEK_038]|uniref:tetratricopeptide repeat protein n=1 Tax=Bacillus sp. DTU_2020_1000418_1_SI_GHA_SEK_038 TaxID=3077585 RepID=UPI0028E437F5|nr:tetratricopeptide repeat protein [Bacillus sp. DTU_2020_1000418_1_SI_GHA_SEK_038]WNS76054.1 tetratricopeptide repeat protein [Bacillus sp. DTU_2020_1000418_1_SI_GHA_SEK_038]
MELIKAEDLVVGLYDIRFERPTLSEQQLKNIELLVQIEVDAIYDELMKNWRAYSQNITQSFTSLQQMKETIKDAQKFSTALQSIEPSKIASSLNQTFHAKRLIKIQEHYTYTFNQLTSSGIADIAERYRLSHQVFQVLADDLLQWNDELIRKIETYNTSYKQLFEVLNKGNATNSEDEIFIFGAGLLASMLAGPLGGIATRTALRSANNPSSQVEQAVWHVLQSLNEIDNFVHAYTASIGKYLIYFFSHTYIGLMEYLKGDLPQIGWGFIDVNPIEKTIIVKKNHQYEKDSERYIQQLKRQAKEAVDQNDWVHAEKNYAALLKAANTDFDLAKVLGIDSAAQTFHSIAKQIEALPEQKKHFAYSKLFQNTYVGMGQIPYFEVNDVIIRYILCTEHAVSKEPEKAIALRGSTVSHFTKYIQNFLSIEKRSRVYRTKDEVISGTTLAIIHTYTQFVSSQGLNVPNKLLDTLTNSSNCTQLVYEQFFKKYINSFTLYLKNKPSNNPFPQDLKKKIMPSSMPEKQLPLIDFYITYEFNELIHLNKLEDSDQSYHEFKENIDQYVSFRHLISDVSNGKNDKDRLFNIAEHYYYGLGIAQNYQKAMEWLKKADQQGHQDAVSLMVDLYNNNKIAINQNHHKHILERFVKENEDTISHYLLGTYYLHSEREKARHHFEIAASGGHIVSAYESGLLNEIKKNKRKAYDYFLQAAEKGHDEAKNKVNQYRKIKFMQIMLFVVAPVTILIIAFVIYNQQQEQKEALQREIEFEEFKKEQEAEHQAWLDANEPFTINVHVTPYCSYLSDYLENFAEPPLPTNGDKKTIEIIVYPQTQIKYEMYEYYYLKKEVDCVVNTIDGNILENGFINNLDHRHTLELLEIINEELASGEYREGFRQLINSIDINYVRNIDQWNEAISLMQSASKKLDDYFKEKGIHEQNNEKTTSEQNNDEYVLSGPANNPNMIGYLYVNSESNYFEYIISPNWEEVLPGKTKWEVVDEMADGSVLLANGYVVSIAGDQDVKFERTKREYPQESFNGVATVNVFFANIPVYKGKNIETEYYLGDGGVYEVSEIYSDGRIRISEDYWVYYDENHMGIEYN